MFGCSSVQDQWQTASQCKGLIPWIPTYSQYCKTSKNLQPAKQGLFLLIPEAAVHMSFAVNFLRFFRTPILYYIDNHIQNRSSKKSRKIRGKTPLLESLFNKVAGLRPAIYLKDTSAQVLSCEFEKFLRTPFLQNTFGRLLK